MNRNWERAKTRCGAPCLCRGSKVGAAEPLSRGVPEDRGDRAAEGREAHFPADVLLQVRRETLWERVGRAEPTPHLASETLALQTSRLTAGGQEPGQGPQQVQGWASRQASWCGKPPRPTRQLQAACIHKARSTRAVGSWQAHHGQVAQVLADLTPPL